MDNEANFVSSPFDAILRRGVVSSGRLPLDNLEKVIATAKIACVQWSKNFRRSPY
jgi:hypothetical protein